MIDCKELKIGNIFWENYGGQKIVTGINCNNVGAYPDSVMGKAINGTVSGLFHCSEIYPIPLDAELLEKCGATGKYKSCGYVFRLNGVTITTQDEDGEGNPIKDYVFHVHIDYGYRGIYYLHDLQNVIYALTGEELNYQPIKQ